MTSRGRVVPDASVQLRGIHLGSEARRGADFVVQPRTGGKKEVQHWQSQVGWDKEAKLPGIINIKTPYPQL